MLASFAFATLAATSSMLSVSVTAFFPRLAVTAVPFIRPALVFMSARDSLYCLKVLFRAVAASIMGRVASFAPSALVAAVFNSVVMVLIELLALVIAFLTASAAFSAFNTNCCSFTASSTSVVSAFCVFLPPRFPLAVLSSLVKLVKKAVEIAKVLLMLSMAALNSAAFVLVVSSFGLLSTTELTNAETLSKTSFTLLGLIAESVSSKVFASSALSLPSVIPVASDFNFEISSAICSFCLTRV